MLQIKYNDIDLWHIWDTEKKGGYVCVGFDTKEHAQNYLDNLHPTPPDQTPQNGKSSRAEEDGGR